MDGLPEVLFTNKVLLAHSHAQLFTHCLESIAEWLPWGPFGPQILNYLLSAP